MLILRKTFYYNSMFNKILRNSKWIKFIHQKNNLATTPRSMSTIHWKQPAFMNGYLIPGRNFTSKAEEEVDVKNLQRIYYGTLAPRMRAVKVFSLTTSLAGLVAQPILLEQGTKWGGTGMAVFLCSFAGFFTFVTPVLLHFITKKYVTEIHYNPIADEYVATTISIILQRIRTKFRASDVKIPEIPGMFTSFNVGNKSLFVDPALFENPEHYVRIMGYDKPIDFKLNFKENESYSATKSETNKSNK